MMVHWLFLVLAFFAGVFTGISLIALTSYGKRNE